MMRIRMVYILWVIIFGIMASALPSQPAQATAQTAFSSTLTYNGNYNASYFQIAFTFLTNNTLDELTGIDLVLVGSSPMTLSLYTSDVAGNRGTFVTTIATTMLGATDIYTFTPTTPIFLQPNSYYWVQTEVATGSLTTSSALPTSDYYTYQTTWLYDVYSSIFSNVSSIAPRVTMRVDTVDTLTASAVCIGDDLQVTISAGDAPFSISVTDSIGTMNSGGNPLGVYTFLGPDTFTNIGITEDTGDLETLNLPDVTCTAPIIPTPPPAPVPPVVLSPDLTALGCDVTANVGITADNTYCRVLMNNGGVVNYAGAVPQNLIDLGVIFAVDVYRLQGGRSITDFGGYSRICLAGQGRLFYLDARTSPRVQVELATETDGNFTCGWIPAAGTLVLTR